MNARERIIAWDKFLKNIRVFLHERGYYQVHTDHLVPAGAFEASIDCIEAEGKFGKLQLHTSPEMEMKRHIAETHLSIYQICRCFRDDPSTAVHRKEFTMLEYYRVYGTYDGLQSEVLELFEYLTEKSFYASRISVTELLFDKTNIALKDVQDVEAFREAARKTLKVDVTSEDTWQDIFFKLWITLVEPALDPVNPVLIYNYPIQIAGLAAPLEAHPHVAQRFEIYWHGMELCNGALELTDPTALRTRYENESLLRQRDGKLAHPRPETLFEAVGTALPQTAGVAVGLERLLAALHGTNHINP